MNIYEYNPGDMYAPVEKAQQYRDQQNTLAANQAALVRANSVKNLIAQNIDPATGQTNYPNAMRDALPEDRIAIQNMMQADAMRQAELGGKETITRGKSLENDKAELNQFRTHATTLFDQPSYDAFRAAYVARYPFLANQLPPKYSPGVKADLLRGTDAALASAHFGNQGGMEGVARDPVTGEVLSPGVRAVATPGELLTAQTAANKLKVDQAAETRQNNAYQSSIDPELQAQLAEAKKRGEEKAGKGPAATSAAAAQAFLTSAGYNAETGADEVSKLIPESTGGAIATGLAKAAGAFNVTTTGQEAIGQLASRSSKLVLDLLGGKLGAGVSNADREFMLQAVGDIGNSMLPVGVRLAAWNDLMGRMKTAAGSGAVSAAAPSPGKPAALPAAAAAQLKENIHTTFSNGQIWTLQNGQPVQVK